MITICRSTYNLCVNKVSKLFDKDAKTPGCDELRLLLTGYFPPINPNDIDITDFDEEELLKRHFFELIFLKVNPDTDSILRDEIEDLLSDHLVFTDKKQAADFNPLTI